LSFFPKKYAAAAPTAITTIAASDITSVEELGGDVEEVEDGARTIVHSEVTAPVEADVNGVLPVVVLKLALVDFEVVKKVLIFVTLLELVVLPGIVTVFVYAAVLALVRT